MFYHRFTLYNYNIQAGEECCLECSEPQPAESQAVVRGSSESGEESETDRATKINHNVNNCAV